MSLDSSERSTRVLLFGAVLFGELHSTQNSGEMSVVVPPLATSNALAIRGAKPAPKVVANWYESEKRV